MEKFSVKKPYTILVAVVMILALGFVSITRMTTELLPDFSIPYMLVITTYPGASPETVEAGVTEPLESELGTISGVENVYSYSMENYSMIQLEFEDDTDMDSALVKISSAINEIESSLPDDAGTPMIMELSMDMVATMYIGVSHEGYDEYELTDYVSDEVIPYLERQEGVASVSSVGLVEETVVVELNQDKIDDLNDELLEAVNDELADAKEALDEAQAEVDEALEELEALQETFGSTLSASIFDELSPTVESSSASLATEIASLQAQIEALKAAAEELKETDTEAAAAEAEAKAQAAAQEAAEAAMEAFTESLTASVDEAVAEAAAQIASEETQEAVSAVISDIASETAEALSTSLSESANEAIAELSPEISQIVSDAAAAATDAAVSSISQSASDAIDAATPVITQAASSIAETAISSLTDTLAAQVSSALTEELTASLTDALTQAVTAAINETMTEYMTSSLSGTSASTEDLVSTAITSLTTSLTTYATQALSTVSTEELSAAMTQTVTTAVSEAVSSVLTDEFKASVTAAAEEAVTSAVNDALSDAETAAAASFTEEEQAALTEKITTAITDAVTDSINAAADAAIQEASEQIDVEAIATEAADAIMTTTSEALTEAAQKAVDAALSSLEGTTSEVTAAAETASDTASDSLDSLIEQLDELSAALESATDSMSEVSSAMDSLEDVYAELSQGQLDAAVAYATASVQLTQAQSTLSEAQDAYDEQREAALESANLDELLSMDTLATLIYAQNFSMPAGYIDDEDDNAWLLKIGDEYEDADDLSEVLLIDNDSIGTIRLSDVADITVIDNADESYATLNGDDGIVLMIYKSSTSGTNAVSSVCNEALEELSAEDDGFEYMILVDQGIYIDLIVQSVLMSILLGGILAIIVLALFLKDIKPTIVVAVSIPLSVLLALVLMYFTGLELNMMTLSGLALGIGMLVDNSIVVLENILRLRNNGMSAARAAVQGAKQVRSAIIASTLTTICVFMPVVFTSGTVRTLLIPLALSIGYCLMASLLVALTVVPAATSTIFRDLKPKKFKLLERIQDKYEVSLRWCLKHKALPLTLAIALFVGTVYAITQMGIIFFPEITTTAVQVTIETRSEDTMEESYAKVDEITQEILSIDGIENVGIMSSSSTTSLLGVSLSSDEVSYGSYVCYVTIPDDTSAKEAQAICDAIEEVTSGIDASIEAESSSMTDMSTLMSGSGLTVDIYGEDTDTLQEISEDLKEIISGIEGFSDIEDSFSDGEEALHLVIDKDKAMSYGLTVAQIYTEIASALTTSTVSTTVWVDSVELDVEIIDETDVLTVETLLDLEFDIESTDTASTDASYDLSSLTGDDEDADQEEEEEEEEETTVRLGDFATLETTVSVSQIDRENQTRYISVTAAVDDGYNTTLLSRELKPLLDDYEDTLGYGYSIEISGETSQISEMLSQIIQMALLGFLFIYLIMVAEFQSLKSPFIVIFTIPLAFTGGMLALLISGQQLSILSLIGFIVLMGTVVNNGIVFVDYTNQLRLGGLERRDALCASGRTRMRPIIMTALTTILALSRLIFGSDMGSQLACGMATVIAGGLLYATLMTLYIIPIIYDIFFKRQPLNIDTGDDLEEVPNDAADYLRLHGHAAQADPDTSPDDANAPAEDADPASDEAEETAAEGNTAIGN